jgi:hypothetical protein
MSDASKKAQILRYSDRLLVIKYITILDEDTKDLLLCRYMQEDPEFDKTWLQEKLLDELHSG